MLSPYTESHEAFRRTLRRFVDQRLAPHATSWDEAGEFPRELYGEAARLELLGLGFPGSLGGTEADMFHRIVMAEELARAGSGGLVGGLTAHYVALPPVVALGGPALAARVVPPVLRGEKIAALAVTEPSGGSDVAHLTTTARRDGDDYVVDGTKTFITNGMRADFIVTAVRTGGPGMEGISLLVVPGDAAGLSRTRLDKMGWWASDTATLHFDGCRVRADNLVGPENAGFMGLVSNFNVERLQLAAGAYAFARVCLDESVRWARERETFGRPLIARQVIRHKLVDMAARIETTLALLEKLAARVERGEQPIAQLCMLKNHAVESLEFCAKEAVGIFGGTGYMRGVVVERIYRETRCLAIGGGGVEIMKELAARQLGW